MAGGVSSLNVSTAGAVVLYEAFRQRRSLARPSDTALPKADTASKRKQQKGLGS
jgi:23S rRNA (guanosine2251-2'-O)-methyltransferase